jgi:beta-phosphoglucomutase
MGRAMAAGGPAGSVGRSVRPAEPRANSPQAVTLKAAVFDLDGVITDTAGLHAAAWRRLALELGWRFDEDLKDGVRGVPRLEALELLASRNGIVLDSGQAHEFSERKNRYYVESISGIGPSDILPGIAALFGELRAAGIRCALASASRNAPAILERLGIGAWFDAVADPSLVPGKPDPGIFLQCTRLLGEDPACCSGIEDAQVGVEAIRAAGMGVVGVGSHLAGADVVVQSTAELCLALLEHALELRG